MTTSNFNVLLSFSLAIISRINAQNGNYSTNMLLHRKCLVVAESAVYSMVNKPAPDQCPGFMCWQSQLTVLNKAKITHMYNEFRNKWAKNEKSNGVIRMKWHWSLEDEALKVISSCPSQELYEYESTRNIEGLVRLLPAIFSYRNQKFRRSSVMHFGCSLTITNSTSNQNRFVCVYCSKEKSVSYASENCTKYTAKNVNASEFPHLCHASKYVDLYGCEPKRACDMSFKPEFWKIDSTGELEKYYVVKSNQDFWLVINRTNHEIKGTETNIKSDVTFTKPVKNSWFLDYSSPSEHMYIYDDETIKLLKSSSPWFFSLEPLRPRRMDKATKMVQYHGIEPEGDYYPICCIYLFFLNLVLFIGLLVLINFTYQHYSNKHP